MSYPATVILLSAPALFFIVFSAPALPLFYSLYVLLRRRKRPRWASALGWLTLWILPALVYQSARWVWPGSPHSAAWPDVLLAAPVGLWVLLGGRSVVEVFEATARGLTGHRDSTMADNVHVFLALTVIECALFIAILVRRDRPWRRDPVALAIGAAFLGDALLAAHWPWWGT